MTIETREYRRINFKNLTPSEQMEINRGYYKKAKETTYEKLYKESYCECCKINIKQFNYNRHIKTMKHIRNNMIFMKDLKIAELEKKL